MSARVHGLAIQIAQRRVRGRGVVPLVGSRAGDMLGRLGVLAGSSARDIQRGLGAGNLAQRCGRLLVRDRCPQSKWDGEAWLRRGVSNLGRLEALHPWVTVATRKSNDER